MELAEKMFFTGCQGEAPGAEPGPGGLQAERDVGEALTSRIRLFPCEGCEAAAIGFTAFRSPCGPGNELDRSLGCGGRNRGLRRLFEDDVYVGPAHSEGTHSCPSRTGGWPVAEGSI